MTRRARHGLIVAAALVVAGLLLVAAANAVHWLTAVPADPEVPGAARVPLKGGSLEPAAVPLALAAAAGLVAAAAAGTMARGVLRAAAAALTVLAGLGVVVGAIRVGTDPAGAVRNVEAARQALASEVANRSLAPLLAVAGGLSLTAAGVLALALRRSWPGLAARYERDDAAPAAASGTTANRTGSGPAPTTTWDALERGVDPTADR